MKYLMFLLLFPGSVLRATTLPLSTAYTVSLTWDAPVNNQDPVVGYFAYKSLSGDNNFSELNSSPVIVTSYSDDALLYGVSYDYYVTSVDASGVQSVPSNTVTLSIPFVPYTPVVGAIQ